MLQTQALATQEIYPLPSEGLDIAHDTKFHNLHAPHVLPSKHFHNPLFLTTLFSQVHPNQ